MGRVCMILPAGVMAVCGPGVAAKANNKTKPTEVPAKVIAHLPLQEAAGGEMLLQTKGDKHYLYVQKASRQGFTVIDVTKPQVPSLVNRSASSSDATAGKLELVGPDVGLAEVRDQNAKGVIRSADSPTETVKILDLSDPAHPKVLQTFTGVTSIRPDLFSQQRRALDPQSFQARTRASEEEAAVRFGGCPCFHASGLPISHPPTQWQAVNSQAARFPPSHVEPPKTDKTGLKRETGRARSSSMTS